MNSTQKPLNFVDNLDSLLADCRSNDPSSKTLCVLNSMLGCLASLVLPVFIVSGLFGNAVIALIHLWKQKTVSRQGVYFSLIAVSDSCSLVMNGIFWMFLAKGLPWISGGRFGYFHVNESSLACSIVRYFEHLLYLTSSSLFLLMVIDRSVSVYHPLRFQGVTARWAAKAGLSVTVASAALTVPMGVAYRWIIDDENSVVCYVELAKYRDWQVTLINIYSFLLFFPPILPIFLILIANIFLLVKMRRVASERMRIRADGDSTKEKDMVKNSILVMYLSVVYLGCAVPTLVGMLGHYALNLASDEVSVETFFVFWAAVDMGMILILINQSVNWLVMLWKSREFRKNFLQLFGRVTAETQSRSSNTR